MYNMPQNKIQSRKSVDPIEARNPLRPKWRKRSGQIMAAKISRKVLPSW